MTKLHTFAVAAAILGLALPASALAGGGKGKTGNMRPRQILKQFDTNGNGTIDAGAESDALRKAFATNPRLKFLDTNNDGKLDDSEIAAIQGKGKGHAGKRKKNAQSSVPTTVPAPAAPAAPVAN
jgi:EF hand